MVCNIEALIEAVNQGTISAERLDDAVLSILRIKNDYGLFEDNGEFNHAPYEIDLESHQVLVQETTDQSMTLIRDEISALPLPTAITNIRRMRERRTALFFIIMTNPETMTTKTTIPLLKMALRLTDKF